MAESRKSSLGDSLITMITSELQLEALKDKILSFNLLTIKNYCFLSDQMIRDVNHPFPWSQDFHIYEKISNSNWQHILVHESFSTPCVYLVTAHGSDMTNDLMKFKKIIHPKSIVCLWHFDNHISHLNNFKSSIISDLLFISHNLGVDNYLINCFSPIVTHIPACCCQFSKSEIISFSNSYINNKRINKCLFNYVLYEGAYRTSLLNEYSMHISDISEFLLMPSNDRSRYSNLSKLQKFSEWAAYKCSVMLPISNDLSTRFFDSLATGQIPIVPENIYDLDLIMPRYTQDLLGIVRIPNLEIPSVSSGISLALQNFDKLGTAGIVNRINYVTGSGLLQNRIFQMLSAVDSLLCGDLKFTLGESSNKVGVFIFK